MCWNHGQCHRSDKLNEKSVKYKEHFLQISWMKITQDTTIAKYYKLQSLWNLLMITMFLVTFICSILTNSWDKTFCFINTYHVNVISCFHVFETVILVFYWKCRAILSRNEAIWNTKMLFTCGQLCASSSSTDSHLNASCFTKIKNNMFHYNVWCFNLYMTVWLMISKTFAYKT